MLASWRKRYDKAKQHIKKQRHHFANKGPSSQHYGFPSSHIWTWELDHKEGLVLKNWCFWTVVLEETLESPWDCKEFKPVHAKGNQSWMEGLMLKLKLQYSGHQMERADSLEKTLMLAEIEGRRRRGWQRMRQLDGITTDMHLSKPGEMVKDREAWCPWGRKELDATERLNNSNERWRKIISHLKTYFLGNYNKCTGYKSRENPNQQMNLRENKYQINCVGQLLSLQSCLRLQNDHE